jgi:hypothetical protein
MFRANYQHKVQANLTANLEINHCLVVMDYSENMTLQPQDEIESAHWTQKQVTLFPIHIVRHAADSTKDKPLIVKESLIILSGTLLFFFLHPTSHLLTCHFPVGVVFTSSFPLMVFNDFILVTIGNDRLQVFLYSMCST